MENQTGSTNLNSDNNSEVNNYRPVTVLSIFSKMFPALVRSYIQYYYKKFNSPHQYEFVKVRYISSCNLVLFIEIIVEALHSTK